MPKIVALVPMRHHSERVPEKNFRPLAGIPLYPHILRTLEQVDDALREKFYKIYVMY